MNNASYIACKEGERMKKQSVVVGILILLIAVWFSGCEFLPKDYITVHCSARITATLFDKNNNSLWEFPVDLPIKVDFIKDGGERFTLTCKIDLVGGADTETVSFKLYKEQPIEAVMTVQGGYKDYDPTVAVQYQTLSWEQVKAVVDFGDEYSWTPHFYVDLQNNTGV
jgi:hypothetical protein